MSGAVYVLWCAYHMCLAIKSCSTGHVLFCSVGGKHVLCLLMLFLSFKDATKKIHVARLMFHFGSGTATQSILCWLWSHTQTSHLVKSFVQLCVKLKYCSKNLIIAIKNTGNTIHTPTFRKTSQLSLKGFYALMRWFFGFIEI